MKNYKLVLIGLLVSCSLQAMEKHTEWTANMALTYFLTAGSSKKITGQPKRKKTVITEAKNRRAIDNAAIAKAKAETNTEVIKFKNCIRELSCTCINNKKFPFELSEESKNAKTIMKILDICNKDMKIPNIRNKNIRNKKKGLKEVKEIILSQHCRCMNNEEEFFDVKKLPFKIDSMNCKGFSALVALKELMEDWAFSSSYRSSDLDFIYKIVDQFHINPNIIIPNYNLRDFTLSNWKVGDRYTTIFGHAVNLFLFYKIRRFIEKEKSKKQYMIHREQMIEKKDLTKNEIDKYYPLKKERKKCKIKEEKGLDLIEKFLKNRGDPDKIEYALSCNSEPSSLEIVHARYQPCWVCWVQKRPCSTQQRFYREVRSEVRSGRVWTHGHYNWNKPDLCWTAQKVLDEFSPLNDLLSEHVRSRSIKLISGLKEIFDKHGESRKNQ